MARDPFYLAVAKRFGEEAAYEAGWFDDGDPLAALDDDVHWLTTPLAHVRAGLAEVPPGAAGRPDPSLPLVLLGTGAMCPAHEGHVAMMEAARRALVATGRSVVGGFLSPGHDAYIRMKCGSQAIPASQRLERCAELIAGHPWLAVDPWEALHTRTGVNFTDVVVRLQRYLRHHLGQEVLVAYVCGGDNARFALTFATTGACVVVGRPGSGSAWERYRRDPRLVGADVTFVAGEHPASSRAIRASSHSPAAAVVQHEPAQGLCLRVEDAAAVSTMRLGVDRWEGFAASLVDRLAQHIPVRVVTVTGHGPTHPQASSEPFVAIGLDAMLPIGHPIAISRRFALGGYQQLGHVARPGSPPLELQVANLPPGPLVVFDDDCFSGGTVRALEELLPGRILGVHTQTTALPGEDLCDARDFLPGTDHGGLVVDLPDGTLGRAPYLLPYVDPAVRCCVPPDAALQFSLEIWRLAGQLFTGTGIRVADLPAPARRLYECAGFAADCLMVEVCEWHGLGLAVRSS